MIISFLFPSHLAATCVLRQSTIGTLFKEKEPWGISAGRAARWFPVNQIAARCHSVPRDERERDAHIIPPPCSFIREKELLKIMLAPRLLISTYIADHFVSIPLAAAAPFNY
jgi:hypothetical protein